MLIELPRIRAALLLGVLYLTFEAFPTRVFGPQRGFNTELSGLSFLGLGIGTLIGLLTMPFWIRVYQEERIPFWETARRREAKEVMERRRAQVERGEEVTMRKAPEPESRLLTGMVGAVLVPIGASLLRIRL